MVKFIENQSKCWASWLFFLFMLNFWLKKRFNLHFKFFLFYFQLVFWIPQKKNRFSFFFLFEENSNYLILICFALTTQFSPFFLLALLKKNLHFPLFFMFVITSSVIFPISLDIFFFHLNWMMMFSSQINRFRVNLSLIFENVVTLARNSSPLSQNRGRR